RDWSSDVCSSDLLTPGVDLLPGEAVLLLEVLVVVRGGIHSGQPVPEPGLRILYGLPLCGVTGLVSEGVRQARGIQDAAVDRDRACVLAEVPQAVPVCQVEVDGHV